MKYVYLLVGLSFLFSCEDSGSDILYTKSKPARVNIEMVEGRIKLTWEAPSYVDDNIPINELEYEIYKNENNKFNIIATTRNTDYIITEPPTTGINIFKIRAVFTDRHTIHSDFSDESFIFIEKNKNKKDIKALYSLMIENPKNKLEWEFVFDSREPVDIKKYDNTIEFSYIEGEFRVTTLNLSMSENESMMISNVSDISLLTTLESLYCSSNQIETLNVTSNNKLKILHCNNNKLKILDVSNNNRLQSLNCSYNQLSTLKMEDNMLLEFLTCNNNELASLDVSRTQINLLFCQNNKLSSLNLDETLSLKSLFCNNNELTSLDLTSSPLLTNLICNNNKLSYLNINDNKHLTSIACNSNQLLVLDVRSSKMLTQLLCENNKISTLDISSNEKLRMLTCNDNLLNRGSVTIQQSFIDESQSVDITQPNYLFPNKESTIYLIVGDN